MKCHDHPDREAFARCSICHRPFCKEDLVKVGDEYVCIHCLKKLLKKTVSGTRTPYKSLNLSLFLSASLYTILAVFIFLINLHLLPYVTEDLRSLEARYFFTQILFVLILFVEVLLILISNKSSLILGFLLSVWFVVLPFIQVPPLELNLINTVFYIVIPLLALLFLFVGKEGLEHEPFYR